jgi:hypothetical protein
MPLPSPPVSLLVRRKLNPNYVVRGSQTAPTSKKLSSGLHFSPEALKTPGTAQGTDVHQEGPDRSVGERPAINPLSRLARVSQKPDAVFQTSSRRRETAYEKLHTHVADIAGFFRGGAGQLSRPTA